MSIKNRISPPCDIVDVSPRWSIYDVRTNSPETFHEMRCVRKVKDAAWLPPTKHKSAPRPQKSRKVAK